MQWTTSFVIQPKLELVENVQKFGMDSLIDLIDPLLWTAKMTDAKSLVRPDKGRLIKLLFVDMVIRERAGLAGYTDVFNDLRRTTDCFDRHWTLVEAILDNSAEDALEESLRYGDVASMLPTGDDELDRELEDALSSWRARV